MIFVIALLDIHLVIFFCQYLDPLRIVLSVLAMERNNRRHCRTHTNARHVVVVALLIDETFPVLVVAVLCDIQSSELVGIILTLASWHLLFLSAELLLRRESTKKGAG